MLPECLPMEKGSDHIYGENTIPQYGLVSLICLKKSGLEELRFNFENFCKQFILERKEVHSQILYSKKLKTSITAKERERENEKNPESL